MISVKDAEFGFYQHNMHTPRKFGTNFELCYFGNIAFTSLSFLHIYIYIHNYIHTYIQTKVNGLKLVEILQLNDMLGIERVTSSK